jgi:hypothetical protein
MVQTLNDQKVQSVTDNEKLKRDLQKSNAESISFVKRLEEMSKHCDEADTAKESQERLVFK